MMKRLIGWYSKYGLPKLPTCEAQYRKVFNAATNDADRAELLIFESIPMERQCHQWYLKSFRVSYGKKASQNIESAKPWTYKGANVFEDLYSYISNLLTGIDYVGPLTYYDIALRLAIRDGNKALFPKNNVYISSLPVNAFRMLVAKGYVNYTGVISPANIIPYKQLAPYFGSLTPAQIEDLLCAVAKSIRRLKKNGGKIDARLRISLQELDQIVLAMKLVP